MANPNVNTNVVAYNSLPGNDTWSVNNYTIDGTANDAGLEYRNPPHGPIRQFEIEPALKPGFDVYVQNSLRGATRLQFNTMVSGWEHARLVWLFKNDLSGRAMEPEPSGVGRDCPIMLTPIYNVGEGRDTVDREKFRNDSRVVHHVDRFNGYPVSNVTTAQQAWNEAVIWYRGLYEQYIGEREEAAMNHAGLAAVIRARAMLVGVDNPVPQNWVPNLGLMNSGDIEEIRRGMKRHRIDPSDAIRFCLTGVPIPRLLPVPGDDGDANP